MSLNIVLAYESSALAAPQWFRDGMQTAANILDSLIADSITVTIRVGYGDWNNQDFGITTGAEGGDLNGLSVSYTSLRAALASHETSALDQTFVNSLPNTSSVNGVSNLYVPSAVDKALGLLSPTYPIVDGAVGMGTQIPSSLLVGVALHELTHAMGREPGAGTFDLLRYTSAGNHLFGFSIPAPAAYFSIDGGNTKLADFGQNSDPSDFLNSGVQGNNDPFDEYYGYSTTQGLTTVDKELLDALGFDATPTPIVIESYGSTSLVQIGNNYFLYPVGGSSGPELQYNGAPVVAGQFGGYVPIAGEQTATGYDLCWRLPGADSYGVWALASNGNFSSSILAPTSGTNPALESLETVFKQDLNGDGTIGFNLPKTVIEAFGSTSLVQIGNNYFFYPVGGSSGPELQYNGAPVVAGQFGGYVPIAGEQTATGYDLCWRLPGADSYGVWALASNGNFSSSILAPTSGTNPALESIETVFKQDLNGDGVIGLNLPETVIEAFGSTSLVQIGDYYFLYPVGGSSGPEVSYNGMPVVAGQFGAYVPIAGEQTASGYDLCWRLPGADSFGVWALDSNGNFNSSILDPTSGTNPALESLETVFKQDLNGDGKIGVPTSAFHINLIADASVANAPAGFAAAMQTAASLLQQAFSDNITINLRYGWGSYNNVTQSNLQGVAVAEGGYLYSQSIPYSTLRSWLLADATSPDDSTAYSHLPADATSFPISNTSFDVSSAELRALGQFTGSNGTIDGATGFGTGWTDPNSWVGAALHEFTHAMGRISGWNISQYGPNIEDMFRYDSAGHFQWGLNNTTSPPFTPAYLSIEGGTTRLANFNTTSDPGDFAVDSYTPNDPFNWSINDSSNALTTLDLRNMDVLGFTRAGYTPTHVSADTASSDSTLTPNLALLGHYMASTFVTSSGDLSSTPIASDASTPQSFLAKHAA